MKNATFLMPKPQVKIVGGEFRFTGKRIDITGQVDANSKALDYLKAAAGIYDYKPDPADWGVGWGYDFSMKEVRSDADQALSLLDRNRLKSDLKEKGYAFLMANEQVPDKFKDYRNKGFLAGICRVVGGQVHEKLSSEDGMDIRHPTTQEDLALQDSNDYYKNVSANYSKNLAEVVLELEHGKQEVNTYSDRDDKLTVVKEKIKVLIPKRVVSFRSFRGRYEARSVVRAVSSLDRGDYGVAAVVNA